MPKIGEGLPEEEKEGFWWYRAYAPAEELGAYPTPPWLFPPETWSSRCTALYNLKPRAGYFNDDHERVCRLVQGSLRERDYVRRLITGVYDPSILHHAIIKTVDNGRFHDLHITVADGFKPPRPTTDTEVQFAIAGSGQRFGADSLTEKGHITTVKSQGRFGVRVPGPELEGYASESEVLIAMSIRPNINTKPIDAQIVALRRASTPCVFGDLDNYNNGDYGFSLQRMLLAQDLELDRDSPYYLMLDINQLSNVPLSISQRLMKGDQMHWRIGRRKQLPLLILRVPFTQHLPHPYPHPLLLMVSLKSKTPAKLQSSLQIRNEIKMLGADLDKAVEAGDLETRDLLMDQLEELYDKLELLEKQEKK